MRLTPGVIQGMPMTGGFLVDGFAPPPGGRACRAGDPRHAFAGWGLRVTTESFVAAWTPPGAYEVDTTLPWPGMVFTESYGRGRHAFGTGRLQPFKARPGGFSVLPANCAYRSVMELGWSGIVLFKEGFLARLSPGKGSRPEAGLAPAFVESDSDVQVLCRHYRKAFSQVLGGNLLFLEAAVALLGARLLSQGKGRTRRLQRAAEPPAPDKIDRAVGFIEARLDRRLSLPEIAAAAGMGRRDFARRFKAALGQTPHQYVLARRLERARDLLATTDRAIADIAYAVGFASQAHMTDSFRRVLGTTPGRCRRAAHR